MPRDTPLPEDTDRLQSWVNGVTRGSLDHPSGEDSLNPALVPLPRSDTTGNSSHASSTNSTRDLPGQRQKANISAELHNSPVKYLVDPVSQHDDTASQARPGATVPSARIRPSTTNTVSTLQISLLESRPTSVATTKPATPTRSNVSDLPTATASVDSLLQLQNAVSAKPHVSSPGSAAPLASEEPKPDYWTRIGPLLDCLPHLRAIAEVNGRHRTKGFVRCMDYVRGHEQPRLHDPLRPGKTFMDSIRGLKHVADPEVTTRFIIVEDLSAEIINCIGSVFEVDPELFAEHLNRSGYGGMDYEDALPTHWISNANISLKWYRPVKQNPKVTQWMEVPGALLDMKQITNKTNAAQKMAAGSITWSDPSYSADGRPNEDASRHQAVISTNIFRRSWTLSTRPGTRTKTFKQTTHRGGSSSCSESSRRPTYATNAFDFDWEHDAVPTAWEEKASFFRYCQGTVPIDPLPSISDFQTPLKLHKKKQRSSSTGNVEPVEIKMEMALPILPRSPLQFPKNKYHASAKDLQSLKDATHDLMSTATAMRVQSETVSEWKAFRADPILALLRVVQLDSKAFFSSLEWALDEISQDSLDDYLMSRRLEDWRKLMSDFEIEVPAIGKSLHDFAAFVFHDGAETRLPDKIQLIIDDVDANIARLKLRLDEAYTALRADMQFSESRRSINEAKTVTKLTELAFIFIPLSFTASLFSMSINELDNGVPAWTFVVTSLGMALLAYGVRLVLTSDFVAESSRGALERFYASTGVQRGAEAPFSTIAYFTLWEMWENGGAKLLDNAFVILFFGSIIVVPVALAWTSTTLDVGFHLAITLFLVLSSVALALWLFLDLGTGGEYLTAWGRGSDAYSDDSGEEV